MDGRFIVRGCRERIKDGEKGFEILWTSEKVKKGDLLLSKVSPPWTELIGGEKLLDGVGKGEFILRVALKEF